MAFRDNDLTVASDPGLPQRLAADVLRCLRFYSRLPVPVLPWENDPHRPPDFETMPRLVPIAGAVIGTVGAAMLLLAEALGLGNSIAAALSVATLTLATGAFHEDGLADTADGFGGGATPAGRLEIMKDSRIGAFGGAALILAYALRIAALAELISRLGPWTSAVAVILVAASSRTAGLILMTLIPPARMAGWSYAVGQPSWRTLGVAWLVCAVLASLAALTAPLAPAGILLALILAAFVALIMTRLSSKLIGGQTGDVGGATQQLAEIAALLGLLIAARP